MNCKTVVKQVKLFTRMVHSDMRHFLWYARHELILMGASP